MVWQRGRRIILLRSRAGCIRANTGITCFLVGRLEAVKRADLAIRALASVPAPLRLIVVGDGSQRSAAERTQRRRAADRVVFAGTSTGDDLISLYAGALAVVYVPFDEDYGHATLEAFLAMKPVVTASDSGGTLEFVRDGENGSFCVPEPEPIGLAIAQLAGNRNRARELGERGRARALEITWDGVIEQLVGWNQLRYRSSSPPSMKRHHQPPGAAPRASAPWREVIVVTTASSDATADVARSAGVRHSDIPTTKATALLKTGIRHASGEFVLILDGDGQHSPDDARRIVALGDYDLVVGARSASTHASTGRRAGNGLLNLLASHLTGRPIPDLTSGFRAARRECLREFMHLLPNGFLYADDDHAGVHPRGIQRRVRTRKRTTAHRPFEDSVCERRREVPAHIAEDRDCVQPAASFRSDQPGRVLVGTGARRLERRGEREDSKRAVLLILFAALVLLVGLVSEQVSSLRFSTSVSTRERED